MRRRLLAAACLTAIGAGGLLHLAGQPEAGNGVWAGATAATLVPLVWSVLHTLLRRDVGVDAIALVAIAGSLALSEYLAGAVTSAQSRIRAHRRRRARYRRERRP
jgi:hypothetical protein